MFQNLCPLESKSWTTKCFVSEGSNNAMVESICNKCIDWFVIAGLCSRWLTLETWYDVISWQLLLSGSKGRKKEHTSFRDGNRIFGNWKAKEQYQYHQNLIGITWCLFDTNCICWTLYHVLFWTVLNKVIMQIGDEISHSAIYYILHEKWSQQQKIRLLFVATNWLFPSVIDPSINPKISMTHSGLNSTCVAQQAPVHNTQIWELSWYAIVFAIPIKSCSFSTTSAK